ncbi:hypothetical protein NQ314_000382 [Rhamnusium bicolor]|uniref:Uncharacterized protein n=1 Tax=Rhamnusium bicolor TaxID=1586634 RepID=A0AAV8ZVS4_9CUCU|nr:hypothetical protein NQ314_000382 [Rhamnusium bicolor]
MDDFYVNDMLSGTSTREEAIIMGNEVSTILKSDGMHLRKWISNDAVVIRQINEGDCNSEAFHFGKNDSNKTLGLYWSFQKDAFMYSINFSSVNVNTKRSIRYIKDL